VDVSVWRKHYGCVGEYFSGKLVFCGFSGEIFTIGFKSISRVQLYVWSEPTLPFQYVDVLVFHVAKRCCGLLASNVVNVLFAQRNKEVKQFCITFRSVFVVLRARTRVCVYVCMYACFSAYVLTRAYARIRTCTYVCGCNGVCGRMCARECFSRSFVTFFRDAVSYVKSPVFVTQAQECVTIPRPV
jgi:hypothetical protein